MSDPQQDKLRELYRRSRQEQPSVDLDRQIRDAARRPVQRRSRRWIWGLSTAAVLMLSFTVVLDLYLGDRVQEPLYFNDFQSSIKPAQVERKAMGRERADEEIEQQYRAPAAPAAEPVIDFYEVLKSREMEIEPDLSAAVPAEKSKKEHSARVQRSSATCRWCTGDAPRPPCPVQSDRP